MVRTSSVVVHGVVSSVDARTSLADSHAWSFVELTVLQVIRGTLTPA